jgi:hypothetical protein
MSSKNIVDGQRSGQSATSIKSRLNRGVSDNETLANVQRAKRTLAIDQ